MRRQAKAYRRRVLAPALCFLLLLTTFSTKAADWKTIAPGVNYIDIRANLLTPWSHVHVFRIDLKHNQLSLVMAPALSKHHASIEEFAQHSKALLALNGGFFDKNYHPLGLRISNQRQYSALKQISWWGIFYTKNHKPSISSLKAYDDDQHVDFAVQSGPRLLVKGRIPSLKIGRAERSALGISSDGHVIIVVTENSPMSTTDLAELMKSPPLECEDALNLDGGSSSQVYVKNHNFELNVHGFSNVSDAIVVQPLNEIG